MRPRCGSTSPCTTYNSQELVSWHSEVLKTDMFILEVPQGVSDSDSEGPGRNSSSFIRGLYDSHERAQTQREFTGTLKYFPMMGS